MHALAKVGFSQSYTYFTWKNTRWELREYVTRARRTAERPTTSARTSSSTRPTSSATTCRRGGPAGFASRLRARRDALAELRHLLGLRALRGDAARAPAPRSTSTPRSTRSSSVRSTGRCSALLAQAERDPPRAPRACSASTDCVSSRPRTTRCSATPSATATRRVLVVVDARSAAVPQEGMLIVPAELGLPPAFAVRRPARRRALSRGGVGRNYVRLDPGVRRRRTYSRGSGALHGDHAGTRC